MVGVFDERDDNEERDSQELEESKRQQVSTKSSSKVQAPYRRVASDRARQGSEGEMR